MDDPAAVGLDRFANAFVLTGADRCDSNVSERAYVKWIFPDGGDQVLCKHHADLHELKLSLIALKVVDLRAEIFQPVDVSA